MFTSLEEIVRKSKLENKPVSELMIEQEIELNGVTRSAVEKLMKRNLKCNDASCRRRFGGSEFKNRTYWRRC